jgi:hypothetical protein
VTKTITRRDFLRALPYLIGDYIAGRLEAFGAWLKRTFN